MAYTVKHLRDLTRTSMLDAGDSVDVRGATQLCVLCSFGNVASGEFCDVSRTVSQCCISTESQNYNIDWVCQSYGWRNREGGTGRDLPLRAPINSISWVGPGGIQYITKMGPFYFS